MTKYLTGAYPDGYVEAHGLTKLVIEASASIQGAGVGGPAALVNYGLISSNNSGISTISGSEGPITNFNTIQGATYGIFFEGSMQITNGSASRTTALVAGGRSGIFFEGEIRLNNYGTIQGGTRSGVLSDGYGSVTNGSAGDTLAFIEGYSGIDHPYSLPITVENFGKIEGTTGYGVILGQSGTLTNGSATDTTAIIQGGYGGVFANGKADKILNFGSIVATVATRPRGSYGLTIFKRMTVTNGSVDDPTALISGETGITTRGHATITNFGTIDGTKGTAIGFYGADDVLRIEAGSVIEGDVLGNHSTLVLASGRQTVASIASGTTKGGTITLLGKGHATTFGNFGALTISKGDRPTLTGPGVIAANGIPVLTVNGGLTVAGTLDVEGSILGAGTVALKGGGAVEIDNAAPASLTVAFKGADAALALKDPSAFASTIGGFASGDTIDLLDIVATSAVLGAGDKLVITDGSTAVATLQLSGDYAGATFSTASDGVGGTSITVSAGPGHRPPPTGRRVHPFIDAAAAFGAKTSEALELTAEEHGERMRTPLAAPRMQTA